MSEGVTVYMSAVFVRICRVVPFALQQRSRQTGDLDWIADTEPTRSRRRWSLLLLLGVVLLPMVGCGGCGEDIVPDSEAAKKRLDEEELAKEEKEKEKEKKPDFEIGVMRTLPNPIVTVESMNKPGHWTSAQLELVANNFDFKGEMVTDPFLLPGTGFSMGTSRAAVLPKGQTKFLELTYFVPPGPKGVSAMTRLKQSERGGEVLASSHPMMRIPTHQFYLLVLSREQDRYGFVKRLDSIVPPGGDELADTGQTAHYRVLTPPIDNRVPLPSHALTWTSIAYIIWDDVEPSVLTSDQQQAMLDWLHWGGQLIISGPASLDTLAGSFLEPYLPAVSEGSVDLTDEDFAPLNENWRFADKTETVIVPEVKPAASWSGVKIRLSDDAAMLDGMGDLVVERRTGRGRIVVTRFAIGQQGLVNWHGYDNVFNACLLRRPPRYYSEGDQFTLNCRWAGRHFRNDPRLISQVRYHSRDEGASYAYLNELAARERQMQMGNYMAWQPGNVTNWDEEPRIEPGVAGWSDLNATANAARNSLQQASGIDVPDASFVLRMLVGYLVILVPINYAIFRSMGRVEWAWVAVPVISLGCSALIVQLAQLDIGFVRAETEVGVVEVQPGYDRAHVTRYVSLYTSISTQYDFDFDDPGALVQPFSVTGKETLLAGQSPTVVNYRRDRGVTLSGYQVASNSLGMVHCEHVSELGGKISLRRQGGRTTLVNDSLMTIKDAGIIAPGGVARLGTVEPGASVTFELAARGDDDPSLWAGPTGNQSSRTGDAATEPVASSKGTLDIGGLLRWAEEHCPEGETRLIGWSDEKLPGMAMVPAASQQRQANVIVAHLEHAPLAVAQPDVTPRPREKEDYLTTDGEPAQ